MKNTFVIDEDVFVFAQKSEDDKGNLDITASKLVYDILYNCHAIAVDDTLWKKYSQKLNALTKGGKLIGRNILSLFNLALHDTNKGKWVAHVRSIECETEIPEDDRYLVRLAVHASAILVTDDDPLKDCIKKSCLTKRYHLLAISPQKAIDYASPEHM